MPAFPGGEDALIQYLIDNLRLPLQPPGKGRSEILSCEFIIDTEGRVRYPHIVTGITPAYNHEVRRVLLSMPLWTPGKRYGQTAIVKYSLHFQLALP